MSPQAASPDPVVRAVAITAGQHVPSRIFRIQALMPYFMERGISLDELCPRVSSYPPVNWLYRPAWILAAMAERVSFPWRAGGYDVVILQRELLSTLATFERWLPQPLIFDVDDAIFLRRKGIAARTISRYSELVVCGNAYLAENFSKWAKNVAIIPTGVDTESLRPRRQDVASEELRIGWIGTLANYPFLESIAPALTNVLKANGRVSLQVISNTYPEFLRHLGKQLDFRQWRPGIESELIPHFSVGIMPLYDDEWARGKCAFKMLQYMAAGIPVVVSPVGVNAELLRDADLGLAAVNARDWSESLTALLGSEQLRARMGDNGRRVAVEKYSLPVVADLWQQQLRRIL